jgi:hypothetical protein
MLRASPKETGVAQVESCVDAELKELSSAEAADATNVPMEGISMDLDTELDDEEGPLRRHCALHILDNVPDRLRLLKELRPYIENEFGFNTSEYLIGKYLPRGGIQLFVHKSRASECNVPRGSQPRELSQGVTISRVYNRRAEAEHSVILYRVPLSFPVENFIEWFGEDLSTVRRWKRKGSQEESEIVELVFYDKDDANYQIKQRYVKLEGMAFKAEPKFVQRPRVCRVCKKINPDHNPAQCKTITCGRCSGDHATRDHPIDQDNLKCPNCGEEHEFLACPGRAQELKRSLRDQKKSYRDALARSTHRGPTPRRQTASDNVVTEASLDSILRDIDNAGLIRILLEKLLSKYRNAILTEESQPETLPQTTTEPSESSEEKERTISKRREHTPGSDGSRPPVGKKPRSNFDPNCPKGCGFICHKPGPMSQHANACTGVPKTKNSRNKSTSAKKYFQPDGQPLITFLSSTPIRSKQH